MKETDPLDVLTNPYREEEKRKIYERAVEKANKDQALYTVLAKLTESDKK